MFEVTQVLSEDDLIKYAADIWKKYPDINKFIANSGFADAYIEDDHCLLIGHRPEIAPKKYEIVFYEAMTKNQLSLALTKYGLQIPKSYQEFLTHSNGAQLCELSFFGLAIKAENPTNLVNRSSRNPFSLITANQHWMYDYPDVDSSFFHFASRNYSWTGQVGYFLMLDGGVARFSKPHTGDIWPPKYWASFDEWLKDELVEVWRHRPAFLEEIERENSKPVPYLQRIANFFSLLSIEISSRF